MAWSKPFSDVEVAYIEKCYGTASCQEIAQKLGRSRRGVEKVVARLGLRERRAPAHAREEAADEGASNLCGEDGEAQDELAELRELRRILKRSMREDAGPQSLPRLSAEFRETVKRISELEGGDDDVGGFQAGGGSVLVAVPLRPA